MNIEEGRSPQQTQVDVSAKRLKDFAGSRDAQVELLTLRLQGVLFDIKNTISDCDREGSKKLYFAARAIGTVLDYLEGHEGRESGASA